MNTIFHKYMTVISVNGIQIDIATIKLGFPNYPVMKLSYTSKRKAL